MTPYHDAIHGKVERLRDSASDPERFHAERDDLYRQALQHITLGCHRPEEVASLVLEAEKIPVRWEACA